MARRSYARRALFKIGFEDCGEYRLANRLRFRHSFLTQLLTMLGPQIVLHFRPHDLIKGEVMPEYGKPERMLVKWERIVILQ